MYFFPGGRFCVGPELPGSVGRLIELLFAGVVLPAEGSAFGVGESFGSFDGRSIVGSSSGFCTTVVCPPPNTAKPITTVVTQMTKIAPAMSAMGSMVIADGPAAVLD